MTAVHHTEDGRAQRAVWTWWALLFCAIGVYVWGLGGKNIPSNGDEMVYAHIARLTAESGHWLPLHSELIEMRNTKPPLLFWQAMVAGDWGQSWTLFNLRLPSLVYTLLITAAVAGITWSISRSRQVALSAASLYLAFYCTFRYGRPYLTSAAETFWLNLPLFIVLWQLLRPQRLHAGAPPSLTHALKPSWPWVLVFGLFWGIGAAYKSFALIAPAALTLWCALLWLQMREGAGMTGRRSWHRVWSLSLRLAVSVMLGVGIFALWLAIDPDPAAVWREFIVRENAGKMSHTEGYWRTALSGGSSIWVQALAYAQNAGLLAFAMLGLIALGVQQIYRRQRGAASASATHVALDTTPWTHRQGPLACHILIIAALVWWLVFVIPSQRSARYVIPAMPALACLLALYGARIHRTWLLLSLALAAITLLVLTRLSWVAHAAGASSGFLLALSAGVAVGGAAVIGLGVWRNRWTLWSLIAACIAVYAALNTLLAAPEGPSGRFDTAAAQQLKGQRIAVPSSFNGSFERYTFLMPGNTWAPYDPAGPATLAALLSTHEAVVWSINGSNDLAAPCPPRECRVLAERWDFRTRHASGEVRLDNLWQAQQWLLKKEWLLQRAP